MRPPHIPANAPRTILGAIRADMRTLARKMESEQPEWAEELYILADRTKYRTAIKRAPPLHRPITVSLVYDVKEFMSDVDNREIDNQTIGVKFDLHAGRISEIDNGKYDWMTARPPAAPACYLERQTPQSFADKACSRCLFRRHCSPLRKET